MFDLYDNDRLIKWKQFRDSIETSQTPLEDVAHLWSRAPFVSSYLNPLTQKEHFIVNMVVHISCEATTIECSCYKRSLPTI